MAVLDLASGPLRFRTLTEREQQVAALVCSGLANKEIARELGLCEGTVKQHLHNAYCKLRVGNCSGLIITLLDPKKAESSNGRGI